MHARFRLLGYCRFSALVCVVLALASRADAAVDALVTVAEDATVYASAPDAVHGDETELRSGTDARAFLQFRLPPPGDGAIVSATLIGDARRPYPTSPVRFHDVSLVADDAWSESTLTWNTQPQAAPAPFAQIDITQVSGSAPIVLDVSALAQAAQADDGRLSLRIAAAAGAVGNEVRLLAYNPAYGETSGFRLELALDRRPRARAGDLLRVETGPDAPFQGVIASDPETFVRKRVTPMVLPSWIWDLTRDPTDGSLLALDRGRDRVVTRLLRFDATTSNPSVVSETGELTRYSALAVGPTGEIYATAGDSFRERRVVRIDPETGLHQVLWTDPGADSFSRLTALTVGPEGSLLVARTVDDWWMTEILRLDLATGLASSVTTLPRASDLTMDADGALWVVANDPVLTPASQRIIRVDLDTGVQSEVCTTPKPVESVVPEPGGTLLLIAPLDPSQATPGGGYIDRFDPATGLHTQLVEDVPSSIGGVILEPDGSWTAAWTTEEGVRLSRHDPVTYRETVFAAPLGPVYWTQAIAVDRARRVLVLPEHGWRIVEVDMLSGAQRFVTSQPAARFWISRPAKQMTGIAIGADERLYAVEVEYEATVRLQEIDRATGARRDLATFPGFDAAITVAPDGGVLVAPTTHPPYVSSVIRVDPTTGAQTSVSSGAFLQFPVELAVDPVSGALVVGDAAAEQLFRIDPETGAGEIVAPTSASAVIDGLGGVFVSGPQRRIDLATGNSTPVRVHGDVLLRARCSDGFDNDHDGATDWPADPGCVTPTQDGEHGPGCGLGAEVALVLVLLARAGRGIRRNRASLQSRSPRHAANAVAVNANPTHSADSAT